MINKIKDFLKNKLGRKRSSEFSDQEEFEDAEEHTGEHQFSEEDQPAGWKERLQGSLANFREKFKKPEREGSEEPTGEFQLDNNDKPGLKERLAASFESLRGKYLRPRNVKPLKLPEADKGKSRSTNLISPSLGQNIERILGRAGREPVHQAFMVALICVVTYSLGKITALALKGTPVLDSARDYVVSVPFDRDFKPATLGQVRSINPFRTDRGLGGPKKIAETKCQEAQRSSNLPIKLVNTVVLQDSVKSLASVQVRGDRDLQEVREGDQISNLAKIFKISRLGILVRNLESGVCESITSDKAMERRSPISVLSPSDSRKFTANKKMPGIQNQGNKFTIEKSLLDEKMKDIGSILTQARAIKIQNPDGTMSFRLTEVDPEGIFPYLGLQDQDIITSINGKPIYDMNEVMSQFSKIKNLDQLSLGIKREGSETVQEYSIKK